MALKGTLRDFGISEILQLIGHQHKSGTLGVAGPKLEVTVLFDSGQIVDVATKSSLPEYDLGLMMVGAGLLQPSQLETARVQSQQTLQPLEMILVKNKAVELEEVRQIKRLRHLEILYDLFLWKDGEYEFEAGPVSFMANLVIPISSEQVLMDGYRIKDEWPEVARQIPDLRICFRRKPGDFSVDERLHPEDDRIYRMIDGRRTARDLAFLSRQGKFETLKSLVRLQELGRIEVAETAGAEAGLGVSPWPRRREMIFYAVFALFGLLLLNGLRLSPVEGAPQCLHELRAVVEPPRGVLGHGLPEHLLHLRAHPGVEHPERGRRFEQDLAADVHSCRPAVRRG
jgi:hypothetical protein